MKALLTLIFCSIPFLLSAQRTADTLSVHLPGTNLHAIAELPKEKRDSLLRQFGSLGDAPVSVSMYGASQDMQQEFSEVMAGMFRLMKQVLIDPSLAESLEKQMVSLSRKLQSLREDLAYEQAVERLKGSYDEHLRQRMKEYESRNYDNQREKRIAKRELEQELRDIRRDYEDEKARLRKG
ncbi:hypothetical protein ACWKWU_04925 [Chitinophaga lutea]